MIWIYSDTFIRFYSLLLGEIHLFCNENGRTLKILFTSDEKVDLIDETEMSN